MSNREETKKISLVVFLLALLALGGSSILSELLFARSPFIHDEFGYIFQSKIFLSGKLYAPSPCPREAFDFPHIINNGRWYSQYPPGFPMLLMPFVFLGVPWLLNPLLAALSVIVIYFLALELFGKRVALLSSLLCALSIWFLVTSATYLSHTANLFFFSLFLLFIFRSIKSPTILSGILAGASLGFAFLVRPYETAWASLPVVIYYLIKFLKAPGEYLKNIIAFTFSAGFFLFLFLTYNFLTNGHPLITGYEVRYGPEHGIGFGKKGYTDTPHTPFRGALLLGDNFKAINDYLFGWPLSSLFPLIFIFLHKKDKKSKVSEIRLFFITIASLSFGLFFYWGSVVFLGPRQFFTVLPCLIVLCGYGLSRMEDLLPQVIRIPKVGTSINKRVLLGLMLILLFSYSFLFVLPTEAQPKGPGILITFTGHPFRSDYFINTFQKINLTNSLVVLKFLNTNLKEFPAGDWGPGFYFNDPWMRNSIIFARKDEIPYYEFFRHFPQRKIFLYWGTYKKGFLVEVKLANSDFVYGNPIIKCSDESKSFVALVSSPEEVFFHYSDDFRKFLQELFQNRPFDSVDAAWLEEQARSSYKTHDYKRATYFLEAALQIENNYEARYRMLIILAGLYRGLNLDSLSDKILQRVNEANFKDVYDVIPERGF
ncbi:MAG: glycosyltransferase family 39 protein [Candidatus Saccharicenans sp.]|nr:glycosyltransferase family 39 protein [Candidatus Saccharicenans sp.]